MRSARLAVILAILLPMFLVSGRPTEAYSTSWTHDNAHYYAYRGIHERYVYGGSKFRDNNIWDTDEGIDCSGFAAKAWAVEHETAYMTVYHPYSTYSFYFGFPYGAFRDRNVGWFATVWVFRDSQGGPSNHMGLFGVRNTDGTWGTLEARGTAYGVVLHTRSISTLISWNYRRLARKNWV